MPRQLVLVAGAVAVAVGALILLAGGRGSSRQSGAARAGFTGAEVAQLLGQQAQSTADVARSAFGPAASLASAGMASGSQLGQSALALAGRVTDTMGRSTDESTRALARIAGEQTRTITDLTRNAQRPTAALPTQPITPPAATPTPGFPVVTAPPPAALLPHPAPAAPEIMSPAPVLEARTVTVVRGDTLWGIAERHLGSGFRWREIYDRNVGTIGGDPGLIHPGQQLVLP
ncbi:MAG: hypothetical protein DDT21_02423 [Syntrophomonadaceae bacterium]|nr:hypothetical protein [Bacillota bacterium]